jgi:hypothetical protein
MDEIIEGRSQKSGVRSEGSEGGKQKAEGRSQKTQNPTEGYWTPECSITGLDLSKKCAFCQDMYEKKQVSETADGHSKNSSR